MRKALAVLTAGLALALTAQPASAKPPDGYHTVTVKRAGFSMAVPDTWLTLDATSKEFRDRMQQVAEANPQLAPILEQVEASDSKLVAVDQTNPIFSSNVTVDSPGLDKSAISQPRAIKAQLEAPGVFEDVEVHKTKVAGRRALELVGTLEVTGPDGTSAQVYTTMYLVPVKKDVLQITFGTPEDGRQDPTVQTMVDNFKLLR